MKTSQEVFAELRKFFADKAITYEEKIRVWEVLTALRGPDIPNQAMKRATTSVVRYILLTKSVYDFADVFPDEQKSADLRNTYPSSIYDEYGHFLDHMRRAFSALGLSWTTDNSKNQVVMPIIVT